MNDCTELLQRMREVVTSNGNDLTNEHGSFYSMLNRVNDDLVKQER